VTNDKPKYPCSDNACVLIRKFNDLNGDGQREPNEPMLGAIRFDVTVDGRVYTGQTDEAGNLAFCFSQGAQVQARELERANGGLWHTTTNVERMTLDLGCGTTELWVGNALTRLPKTGRGGDAPARPTSSRRYQPI
jgi:hypothetical protein